MMRLAVMVVPIWLESIVNRSQNMRTVHSPRPPHGSDTDGGCQPAR